MNAQAEWSLPLKELPVSYLPATTFGLIVLDSSSVLKVTVPGKGLIKAIFICQGSKKIFYKKVKKKKDEIQAHY